MYQRLCFVMLAIWAVASLGSCRKESVGDSRAETEARTPMRIDMSNQIGEVEQFVNSVLRATNAPSLFSASGYDWSETEFLQNDAGMEVYSVQSLGSDSRYLTMLKRRGRLQSVNLVRITEDTPERVCMEYASVYSEEALFKGYLDKRAGVFHLTYMDESLRGDELRASVEGLLCNASMCGAGASWTFAVGIATGGFGAFAFGLAWTVASYYVCDGL